MPLPSTDVSTQAFRLSDLPPSEHRESSHGEASALFAMGTPILSRYEDQLVFELIARGRRHGLVLFGDGTIRGLKSSEELSRSLAENLLRSDAVGGDPYCSATRRAINSFLNVSPQAERTDFAGLLVVSNAPFPRDIAVGSGEFHLLRGFGREQKSSRRHLLWGFGREAYRPSAGSHLNFSQTLLYAFTDGSVLSPCELPFHPYQVLVPEDFQSLIYDRPTYRSQISADDWLWAADDEAETSIALGYSEILQRYCQASLPSLALWLVQATDWFGKRSAARKAVRSLPLVQTSGVRVLSKDDFTWVCRGDRWELNPIGLENSDGVAASGARIGSRWFLTQGRQLLTHDLTPFFAQQLRCLPEVEDGFQVSVPVSDPTVFNRHLKTVRGQLGIEPKTDGLRHLADTELKPTWNIERQSAEQVTIFISTGDLSLDETVQKGVLPDVASWLTSGIGLFFEQPGEVASAQGERRKQELKLLRHQGFLKCLLSRALAHRGQEDSIESVVRELPEMIRGILGRQDFELTPRMRESIRRVLHQIIDPMNDPIWELARDRWGETVKYEPSTLRLSLIEDILQLLLSQFGDGVFKRGTTRHWKVAYDRDEGLVLEGSGLASALLGLPVEGRHLALGGKRLGTIGGSELSLRFEPADDRDGIDWFALHPSVFFRGRRLSQEKASEFVRGGVVFFEGEPYLIDRKEIPSAQWLDYFWQKLQSKGPAQTRSLEAVDAARNSHILNMMALRAAGIPVVGGEKWQEICEKWDRLSQPNPAQRDTLLDQEHWKVPLRPFQEDGIRWMIDLYELGLGGILGDEMGLGKTVQSIGFLSYLGFKGGQNPHLIVVPPSLAFNWRNEFRRFAPHLQIGSLLSKREIEATELQLGQPRDDRPENIYVTTYGMVHEHLQWFNQVAWDVVIFDEAQFVKNVESKRASQCRKLEARSKFCLTGTPFENHLGEFYSLIDLCVPGALGSYPAFKEKFVPSRGTKKQVWPRDMDFLKMKTKPLVLRRTKKLMAPDLPEKFESLIEIPFEEMQKRIYRDTALSWNDTIGQMVEGQGGKNRQLQMLTALLRLRQICSCPQVVPKVIYPKCPPKLTQLMLSLEELVSKDEPVVVFACFRSTLEILSKELRRQGMDHLTLTGKTPTRQRGKILEKFSDPKGAKILIMTQKVGGFGLNLTSARYVFHLEPWWNPQVENQATDRVHRIGQKRAVNVYRYVIGDSVETRMEWLKGEKQKIFGAMFESGEEGEVSPYSNGSLSQKDFQFLIGEGSSSSADTT